MYLWRMGDRNEYCKASVAFLSIGVQLRMEKGAFLLGIGGMAHSNKGRENKEGLSAIWEVVTQE